MHSVNGFATVGRNPYAYSKVLFSFSFFLFSLFKEASCSLQLGSQLLTTNKCGQRKPSNDSISASAWTVFRQPEDCLIAPHYLLARVNGHDKFKFFRIFHLDILNMCLPARVFTCGFNTTGCAVCQWLSESGPERGTGRGSNKEDLLARVLSIYAVKNFKNQITCYYSG